MHIYRQESARSGKKHSFITFHYIFSVVHLIKRLSQLVNVFCVKNCKAFSSFSAIDHYTYKLCFSIHNIFANMFYEPLFRLGSEKGLSEVNFQKTITNSAIWQKVWTNENKVVFAKASEAKRYKYIKINVSLRRQFVGKNYLI